MPDLFGIDAVASSVAEWRTLAAASGGKVEVVGSYGNGAFANSTVAREALPDAIHVQYDVNGSMPTMDLFDIEPRDGVPGQAHGWARRWQAAKVKRVLIGPGLYCSASIINEVEASMFSSPAAFHALSRGVSDMLDAGFKRGEFIVQSAHYGWPGGRHICGPNTCGFLQADSTQCEDHAPGGQNVDLNLWGAHCFGHLPAPGPDAHYDYYENRPRVIADGRTERWVAERYDHYRAQQTHETHPHRAQLAELRAMAALLAARVAHEARTHPADGKPSWGLYHRGFRHLHMDARAKGHRLV